MALICADNVPNNWHNRTIRCHHPKLCLVASKFSGLIEGYKPISRTPICVFMPRFHGQNCCCSFCGARVDTLADCLDNSGHASGDEGRGARLAEGAAWRRWPFPVNSTFFDANGGTFLPCQPNTRQHRQFSVPNFPLPLKSAGHWTNYCANRKFSHFNFLHINYTKNGIVQN